jgi:hypothetical protein
MPRLSTVGVAIALLLVGPSLSGCLGLEAFSGEERDGCLGLHPMWVAWQHPEAWERSPEDGRHGPWSLRTNVHESGLQFQDDALDAHVGPGNDSLHSVTWTMPEAREAHDQARDRADEGLIIWGAGWGAFRLDRRLSLTATFPVEMAVGQVREHAATFLSAVSAASPDQQQAWIEAFLEDPEVVPIYPAEASGQPPPLGHRFHVDLTGQVTAAGLIDPIDLEEVTEHMLVGSLRVDQGPWRFDLRLATRTAELPRGLGPVRDVQVDPLGNVMANVWKPPPNATVLERVLDQTTHSLGIGALEGAVGKPIVHPDCQQRFTPLTRTL